MITTEVENYPGFPEGIQGPDMMELLIKQAKRFETRFFEGNVAEVSLKSRPFTLKLEDGGGVQSQTLIIATGASARWLGLESENKFNGRGVSACATCDGFFYKKQKVAVIGGGNTAVEEALYLSNIADEVTLVHRRDSLRAEKILQDKLFDKAENGNVNIIWDHTLDEVLGDGTGVTGMRIRSTKGDATQEMDLAGVFIAIGHKPNTDLFQGQLDMENGYIKIRSGLEGMATQTSIPGVFAAGDVVDKRYRQAVTAAGMGCQAAIDAEKWLENQD